MSVSHPEDAPPRIFGRADSVGPTESGHPRRWLILAALVVCLMTVVVDNSVVNVAIPTLIANLHADNAAIQLILDAYLVVFAGFLIVAGALSDRFGRKKALLVGLLLFGGASLPAAFATSPAQLIVLRAVMGLGAAFLMPGTLSIITTVFAAKQLTKAISIWTAALMVGSLLGPVLGGALLEHFWWGSIFLINVPIAVLGFVAVLFLVPESYGQRRGLDMIGAALSVVALAALTWGTIRIAEDGWNAPGTFAGLFIGCAALIVFLLRERRTTVPLLPLGLLRNRMFTGSMAAVFMLSFVSGGFLLAQTQHLQSVIGYSPLHTGIAFIPMIAAALMFNGVGVVIDKRFGARAAICTGLMLVAVGFGALLTVQVTSGYGHLVVALGLIGAGSGCATPATYATLLSTLPAERAGVGSALNDTISQVGQALSIAVLGTILSLGYRTALPHGVPAGAKSSLGEALTLARTTADTSLTTIARTAFVNAEHIMAATALGAALVAVVLAALLIAPRRNDNTAQDPGAASAPKGI